MAVNAELFPWARHLSPAEHLRFSTELESALRQADLAGDDGGYAQQAVDGLIARWHDAAEGVTAAAGPGAPPARPFASRSWADRD